MDININEINGEDKNQNQNNIINTNPNITNENETNLNNNINNEPQSNPEDPKIITNIIEQNEIKEEEPKRQILENNNENVEDYKDINNINNLNNINNINNMNNNDYNNNIQELDEEDNSNNQNNSNEHIPNENEEEEFEEDNINYQAEFNKFIIETGGQEPKGFKLKENSSDEKEEDEKSENNFDENDLDEAIQDDIENENLIGMNDDEQAIELKIRDLLQKLNIPQIIKDAEDELEQEELEKEKNNENKNNEIKENINNNINNDNADSNQNHSNKYLDAAKSTDQKLKDKIKDKIRINYKKQEILAPKFTFYKNEFFQDNSQMFGNDLYSLIQTYKNNSSINKTTPLITYIFSKINYNPTKENEIYRDYLILKILEIEKPQFIWNNMQNFEKRILIPLYQKIIAIRNKHYNFLESIYNAYKKAISNSFQNYNEVIEKIQKYGSFLNTFMVDIGDTDIDICIVPKCSLSYFQTNYLNKLKNGIIKYNLGEINNVIITNNYILLKIKYIHQKGKFNVDITVHNMLPIFNTYLIRLYGLFDQRFHIMGIYLKYWAKTNGLHGAMDNYLSSYALLLMMIHFLQKVVEPKILPNLQKIPINNDLTNPIYGEEIYEYYYNDKKIRINSYYEKDFPKIKQYMEKINEGKENQETVTNLLVKFFEYYAYFFDSKQKISVHKELIESIKERDDNIAFSIDDPFEVTHNPGKSMIKNSDNYKKFIKAMKKEVNFILNGEYVKRLEREKALKLSGTNAKNMS